MEMCQVGRCIVKLHFIVCGFHLCTQTCITEDALCVLNKLKGVDEPLSPIHSIGDKCHIDGALTAGMIMRTGVQNPTFDKSGDCTSINCLWEGPPCIGYLSCDW